MLDQQQNYGANCASAPLSPMESATNSVEAAVHTAHDRLSALTQRLDSLLHLAPPTPGKEGPKGVGSSAPLVNRFEGIASNAQGLCVRIEDLLQRLAI